MNNEILDTIISGTKKRYFLDYASGSPMSTQLITMLSTILEANICNPSGIHWEAQRSEHLLNTAREIFANLLGASSSEIVFTASGTESNNLAIRGAALDNKRKTGKNHLICSAIEHPSIIETVKDLAANYGFSFTLLPVNRVGVVELSTLANALTKDTSLVSVAYANSEIGTIQNIAALAALARKNNVIFHTDAVQAAPWLNIDVEDLQVDLLSIGGQKLGVAGTGALYVRKNISLATVISGGFHEMGFRAGTPSVALVYILAEAFKLYHQNQSEESFRLRTLRQTLFANICEKISGTFITGHLTDRLPNHASFAFEGLEGNTLVKYLDMQGFACSPGSACKIGNSKPSDTLLAMGFSESIATGGLRVSMGSDTRAQYIDTLIKVLPDLVKRAREAFI